MGAGGELLRPQRAIDWRSLFSAVHQLGNSCLLESRAGMARRFLGLRGVQLPRLDATRGYWYARRRHRRQHVDGGTYPRSAWWAGTRYGDVTFEDRERQRYESGVDPILDPPPDLLDFAQLPLRLDAEPIYASGRELIARIGDSLVREQPVQIDVEITRSFTEDSGPTRIEPSERVQDMGHAIEVVGCLPRPDNLLDLIIGNTWGPTWRDSGTAVLTAEFVVQHAYGAHYLRRVTWHGETYT